MSPLGTHSLNHLTHLISISGLSSQEIANKKQITGKSFFEDSCCLKIHLRHMGEISQGVQSLNLMSYLSGVLGPFFGDLGLCYGKN